MAEIITNIPLTYREDDGNLISPIKGKPVELDAEVANALKADGLAEDYSGGGGSSDFSTAEVTFINNSSYTCEFKLICITDDLSNGFSVLQNSTMETNVVLYQDNPTGGYLSNVESDGTVSMSFSGGVEDDGDEYFIVRGTGTVTIADA